MSSEISNSECDLYHGSSWTFADDRKTCSCGEYLGRWTSWTRSNPARRFIGCPKWQDKSKKCGVWEWIDRELTNYYRQQMWDLKHKSINVESSKEAETRLGPRALKVMEMEHEINELKRKKHGVRETFESLKLDRDKVKLKVGRLKTKERVQLTLIISLLLLIVVLLLSFSRGEMRKLKLPI